MYQRLPRAWSSGAQMSALWVVFGGGRLRGDQFECGMGEEGEGEGMMGLIMGGLSGSGVG